MVFVVKTNVEIVRMSCSGCDFSIYLGRRHINVYETLVFMEFIILSGKRVGDRGHRFCLDPSSPPPIYTAHNSRRYVYMIFLHARFYTLNTHFYLPYSNNNSYNNFESLKALPEQNDRWDPKRTSVFYPKTYSLIQHRYSYIHTIVYLLTVAAPVFVIHV